MTAPLSSNLLVLAGAGSGKTTTIIHRIIQLSLIEKNLNNSIMVVTFSNKAAQEIKNRVQNLMSKSIYDKLLIGTFHGLSFLFLKENYKKAKLPKHFSIINNDDQLFILKNIVNSLHLNNKNYSINRVLRYINSKKNEGIRPIKKNFYNNKEKEWNNIYYLYQKICDTNGLIDFSELLLRSYELFLNNSSILSYYKNRFRNILIDEFQDINNIQYSWFRILSNSNTKVMVVCDDDQAIYNWRGAKVENIKRFLKDFPSVETIKLEQNYRSTSNILKAANNLISYNNERIHKKLWTKQPIGKPITIYCALNKIEEAQFIANYIKINHNNSKKFKDIAILYRNNFQSKVLEQILLQNNLPYKLCNNTKFFEYEEVINTISYLKLLLNRNNDSAYEKIVNIPSRGISNHTIEIIRKNAFNKKITLWKSTISLLNDNILNNRANISLKKFVELINSLETEVLELPLHLKIKLILKRTGLWNMYEIKQSKKYNANHIENLKELINISKHYYRNYKEISISLLQDFIFSISLKDEDIFVNKLDSNMDAIKLMTIHASKGLEFKQVFIVGMEEGLFPNKMSINLQNELEEERRLAYVGITRAMEELVFTYSRNQYFYDKKIYFIPSRFIKEIPPCYKRLIYSY